MRSSTLSKILGILVVAILVGGLIGWWASRNPNPVQPAPAPAVPVVTAPVEPAPVAKPIAPATNPEVVTPAPAVATVDTNAFDPALWDEKLDEILGNDSDDSDKKAGQLLDMMDKVGVDAQTEIAGHIVNLVDDKDFSTRAAKFLTNANVPEAVSSIFMNDLYNRDEEMKLPLLLAIVRNDKHPLKDEAKNMLELYVDEDYGTNWNKWEDATKKYLKEHNEEEAPATAAPVQ